MSSQPSSTMSGARLTPQNPWPGLAAFTPENSEFFHGREAEVADIFQRVRAQRLTVLFGVSGLGKTSLLQAGLLPQLGETQFHPILIRLDHRAEADDLVEQVRAEIIQAIPKAAKYGARVPRGPMPGEDLWCYFHDKTTGWRNDEGEPVYPILIFDQFEEIFTRELRAQGMRERRTRFEEWLACLVENSVPEAVKQRIKEGGSSPGSYDFRKSDYRVVISLREDFLAHLESFKQRMPSVMENRMRLERMSEQQAMQAVLGPGREIVEEPVAREIVAFVAGNIRGERDAEEAGDTESTSGVDPVLLSLLCEQLNRRRLERKQTHITKDLLTQEREGIIQSFYEQALKKVDPRVQAWVEDNLLTATGHRAPAAWEDARVLGLPVADFDTLEKDRILHREKHGTVEFLELTHDLLCEPASRCREARRQRQQAAEAAAEREQKLRAQARRLKAVCTVFGLLAFLAIAGMGVMWWYWYAYDRTYFRYYSNYTIRWGVREGVGLLSPDQISRRSSSLKFIYRAKKLIAVQSVDSRGNLKPPDDKSSDTSSKKICQWEYAYDAKGNITYESDYDKGSNLIQGLEYPPPASEKITSRLMFYLSPSGLPKSQVRSTANAEKFIYDKNGLENMISYMDWFGTPQVGPNGEYSDKYEYDTNGMSKEVQYLDKDGNLIPGNAEMIFRDDQGNEIEQYWMDESNHPAINAENYSIFRAKYDEWGNETNWSFYDTNNAPEMPQQKGYFMGYDKYDTNGNAIEEGYSDTNGKPVCIAGDDYAFETIVYNELGDPIERHYLDVSKKPVVTEGDYSILKSEFDTNGNGDLLELGFFDTNDQPGTIPGTSFHKMSMAYNDFGNQIRWASFDTNGVPCNALGYWERTNAYDAQGNMTEEVYFDTAGNPTNDIGGVLEVSNNYDAMGILIQGAYFYNTNSSEYSELVTNYDTKSNVIEVAYFDASRNPTNGPDGYASVKMAYDPRRHLLQRAYYDEYGSLVAIGKGCAMEIMNYDEDGNMVQGFSFGADGELTNGIDDGAEGECARIMMRYDEYRDLIGETLFYKPDAGGYAIQIRAYDAQSNLVDQANFDALANPTDSVDGYHEETNSYDAQNNLIKRSFFNAAGDLTNGPLGYAQISKRYDEQAHPVEDRLFYQPATNGYSVAITSLNTDGNVTEESYYDTADNRTNCLDNYATKTLSYNENGNLTKQVYFDMAGNVTNCAEGYALETNSYDSHHNLAEIAYFNASGDSTNGAEGYAVIFKRYDDQDNLIADTSLYWPYENGYAVAITNYNPSEYVTGQSYFDASSNLTNSQYGYASATNIYDTQSNLIEQAYFDSAGNPTNGTDGYAKIIKVYNASNSLVEDDTFYQPYQDGYAKAVTNYDGTGNSYLTPGNITGQSYYDAFGNLTNTLEGYARGTNVYDVSNNLIERAYFDVSGNLTNALDGYAKIAKKYDSLNNLLEDRVFYQPNKNGYAEVVTNYSLAGNVTGQSYYDTSGNPANCEGGYASLTNFFDEKNNLVAQAYFDQLGKPDAGFAALTNNYDDQGNLLTRGYFDVAGNPANGPEGYACETNGYDEQTNLISEAYYNATGNLTNGPDDYASVEKHYNDRNYLLQERYTCRPGDRGYAMAETNYDGAGNSYSSAGNIINYAYFDSSGNLTNGPDGFACQTNSYDAETNLISVVFYDFSGRAPATGYASETNAYDIQGNLISRTYYNAAGNPTSGPDGYARAKDVYNVKGDLTEILYFDPSDNPANSKEGYARLLLYRDAQGLLSKFLYFDASGKPVQIKE